MKPRTLAATAAACLAVITLGACGSSSDGASTVAPTTPATASVGTVPGAGPGSSGTAGSTSESAATIDTLDSSSSDTLSPDASKECKNLYQQVQGLVAAGPNGLPDEDQLKKVFASMKDFMPDELDADVDTMQTAYTKLIDIVNASGGNVAAASSDPKAIEALGALSSPEVTAASERVEAYLDKECPTG